MLSMRALFAAMAILGAVAPRVMPELPKGGEVTIVQVSGTIDLGVSPFLERLAKAQDENDILILDINTLGGRIDAVFYCPHAADEECACRKPAPGLLEQISDRYGVERDDVQVVGSCVAHLQAGAALGAQLHLVCTGQSAQVHPGGPLPAGVPPGTRVYASLGDFVDQLLPAVQFAAPPLAATPLPTPGGATS